MRFQFATWCDWKKIPRVPVLYQGPFGEADLEALRQGPSVLAPKAQPIREGIVLKLVVDGKDKLRQALSGEKYLKHINDTYLLKNQSDFH